MALKLSGGAEMVTVRLIRSATALHLSEQVPPECGRTIVKLAKAVKLFMECRENAAALHLLGEIEASVKADDEPEMKPAAEVMGRAVEAVRKHLDFEGRFDKVGAA
jgi:hypothetical protein